MSDIEENKDEVVAEDQTSVEDKEAAEIAEVEEESGNQEIVVKKEEFDALVEKGDKLDQLQDDFVRKIADFENAKKRLEREKDDFVKFANEKLIGAFLPVIDNFERALLHANDEASKDGFISGVELIKKQIFDILSSTGLEKIETAGKEFDPHFHEAMGTVETTEHEPDFIVEEIQAGYMLKEKLLRPSWVRIASHPEEETQG